MRRVAEASQKWKRERERKEKLNKSYGDTEYSTRDDILL
jgi:hypothetical protein